MSINLKSPEVPVREMRLQSVTVYNGTAKDLYEKSCRGQGCENCCLFNQNTGCAEGSPMVLLPTVRGAAIINHGPVGCAGDFGGWNNAYKLGLISRGLKEEQIKAISSNIQEKDTVYGGIDKLKDAIQESYRRFSPKVIFIVTSCASGIIGDDIEGAANELQEQLQIPIVPIYCEGFKSRVWSSGFDQVFHGILRKVVKPPRERQDDLINVINFEGTHVFTPLLAKIGLRVRYVVPYSTYEDLERLSEAAASTEICETLGTYVCHALEEVYGVPEVKSPPPYGIGWTDAWLREIARITHREEETEELIQSEHARIRPQLQELREKLKGKTAYIFAGDSFAHSFISVIRALGLRIIGTTAYHHDSHFDSPDQRLNSLKNVLDYGGDIENFSVFTKQPYQAINILRKLKPDLLIFRHPDMAYLGYKLGIPTICIEGDINVNACYDGVLATGEQILRSFESRSLLKNFADHATFPYSKWWYEQDPFYFAGGGKSE